MAKSNSSGQPISTGMKITEAWQQSVMLFKSRGPLTKRSFDEFTAVSDEYVDVARTFGGADLRDRLRPKALPDVFPVGEGV
ncbi:MAG: hypothetical protein VX874_00280 [Pseudomonadota bacterium]|nr:hypothetical protein [Pseudomonadota bacterium]